MILRMGRQGVYCSVHGSLTAQTPLWDTLEIAKAVREHLVAFHPRRLRSAAQEIVQAPVIPAHPLERKSNV